ncbi:hypothetical protein IAT40_003669 [Kwoniella sp. CBS 6097]
MAIETSPYVSDDEARSITLAMISSESNMSKNQDMSASWSNELRYDVGFDDVEPEDVGHSGKTRTMSMPASTSNLAARYDADRVIGQPFSSTEGDIEEYEGSDGDAIDSQYSQYQLANADVDFSQASTPLLDVPESYLSVGPPSNDSVSMPATPTFAPTSYAYDPAPTFLTGDQSPRAARHRIRSPLMLRDCPVSTAGRSASLRPSAGATTCPETAVGSATATGQDPGSSRPPNDGSCSNPGPPRGPSQLAKFLKDLEAIQTYTEVLRQTASRRMAEIETAYTVDHDYDARRFGENVRQKATENNIPRYDKCLKDVDLLSSVIKMSEECSSNNQDVKEVLDPDNINLTVTPVTKAANTEGYYFPDEMTNADDQLTEDEDERLGTYRVEVKSQTSDFDAKLAQIKTDLDVWFAHKRDAPSDASEGGGDGEVVSLAEIHQSLDQLSNDIKSEPPTDKNYIWITPAAPEGLHPKGPWYGTKEIITGYDISFGPKSVTADSGPGGRTARCMTPSQTANASENLQSHGGARSFNHSAAEIIPDGHPRSAVHSVRVNGPVLKREEIRNSFSEVMEKCRTQV